MKLGFWKRIRGMEKLGEYVTKRDPIEYDDKHLIGLNYGLWKISSSLTDGIEKELGSQGFELKRSAGNSIWVAAPEPFALQLDTNIEGCSHGETKRDSYYLGDLDAENFEQIDTKYIERRFRKTKIIPVLMEIPHVYVGGEVKYEMLGGNEPTRLIEALDKLGYASRVTPTPDELVAALERAREAVKRRRSSGDDHTPPSSEDSSINADLSHLL